MIRAHNKSGKDSLRKMILMTMFGAMIYISYQIMSFLPNIHLNALIISVLTIVYRKWAILATFIYVFLSGLFGGFSLWWIPYLYLWPILCLCLLLVPSKLNNKAKAILSLIISALHGFLFGVLYAPAQALLFGLNFEQTLAWIGYGLYFDVMHGIGNIICCSMIYPLVLVLSKLEGCYNVKLS